MHLKKLVSLLLALLLSLSVIGILPVFAVPEVNIRAKSDIIAGYLGDPLLQTDVVGTTFNVAIYVEDTNLTSDLNLYGFDIQFNWTTQWIHYTGYTVTQPVEDYPAVQPPSLYAGILHADTQKLKNVVDESASIPLAEHGTMAWIGYSSSAPAPSFNGSGTICVFNFVVSYQPFCYEGTATIKIHFTKTDLSHTPPPPLTIPHIAEDLEITLYCRKFEYPPSPMLKVLPDEIVASSDCVCKNFTSDVMLLGADGGDLNPLWDVAGIDFYLNFDPVMIDGNSTPMIEAVKVRIDPDGAFGAFWADGTFELAKEIDNIEGWVHVAFIGMGATHSAVFGTIRVAEVTFHMIYEYVGYPPPSTPIYLENPLVPLTWYILDAKGVIINLSNPVTTEWSTIYPNSLIGLGYNVTDWEDVDGDGELSVGDQIILLNKDTLKKNDYYVDRITGTLGLLEKAFNTTEEYLVMDGPTHAYSPWPKTAPGTSDEVWNGYGNPYWTGNFSCKYPVDSVSYIEVFPQIGVPYNLTEGTDFVVNPDGTIWLKTPLDENVTNEFVGTMPDVDLGWPALANIASGISSVWIEDNVTYVGRYANNSGYHGDWAGDEMPPNGEWWFDPDFPYEIESWWASGYVPGPWVWPDGTDIYVNYTAPAFIEVHYTTKPDPRTKYVEWPGDYADFLTTLVAMPTNTLWHEVYWAYCTTWNMTAWGDVDTSGTLNAGDDVTLTTDGLSIGYEVVTVSTDIEVIQKPCVQNEDPADEYYLDPITVEIAGFPHPERDFSPWYGSVYPTRLPNEVENAMYTSCYKVLGRQIDLYLCDYPDGFNGKGPNVPGDMFWPQKEVCLCAKVTYNLWPEQQKDVAFQVNDPYGNTYTLLCARTNDVGLAQACFRLPWMCDDPEYYFGKWTVIATVDVACVHINDTMEFKYDYKVHIWKVTVDPTSYEHYETVTVTIEYGSCAMQEYPILIAVSGLDETGVPFDFARVWIVVGGAEWCTYANGTDSVPLYIPKWARAGKATIYVNALDGWPEAGGVQEYPVVSFDISIGSAP